jgi:hypothetical protein
MTVQRAELLLMIERLLAESPKPDQPAKALAMTGVFTLQDIYNATRSGRFIVLSRAVVEAIAAELRGQ